MDFCVCDTDIDGQCQPCRERVFNSYKAFKDLLFKYMEDMRNLVIEPMKAASCDGCSKKYADAGMATVVRFMLNEIPSEESCRVMMGEFSRLLQSQGVEEAPHLEKAWADVCQKNGWSPV